MADFNPNEHLIQLKSKAGSQDYLPVQFRLVWFRRDCPEGTIETEEVFVDLDREVETEAYVWNAEKRRSEKVVKQAKGYARFRATVTDGKGGRATATGSESAVDFPDYIEKAETKAVGRALAMLGYGTQFAPEFGEQHRIVDAPVDSAETKSGSAPTTAPQSSIRQTPPANQKPTPITSVPRNQVSRPAAPTKPAPQQNAAPTTDQAQAVATAQQKSSIEKLCQHVQMSAPEDLESMSYFDAKALIAQLTAEYKNQRAGSQQATQGTTPEASHPTSTINSPSPKELQKRSDKVLGPGKFDAMKVKVLESNIPDDNLTPEDCGRLKRALDIIEERRAAKAS
jgi:hypothetical protein